ncbi:uncharacterized protein LOC118644830 [Monomorium pharaonis]|uniref:uncharacterized protein LOC118644830 n=1 Tax=Monomorium pharaonis TaxID=307658 RepID=UPI001747BE8B|nr:uncharacterized protein LOC118644830 [Monomorium pharaonis]
MSLKKIILKPENKDIIVRNEWLNDDHIDHFHELLQNCSDYKPVGTWRIQLPHLIQPVLQDAKHIQILYSSSHWVCSYYDRKNIFIYDSLNNKILHKDHEQFLKRLFPTYDFEKCSVKFPTVQQQPNGNDCGVFAIAFAISLLYNIKPDKVRYDHSLMRPHLLKILESNVIEHFPQDLNYVPQKVLPLAVIRAREAIANAQRIKRSKKNTLKNECHDIDNNQVKKRHINEYNSLIEDNRGKKHYLDNDLENVCLEKRLRYLQNLEQNRAKQLNQYRTDLLNNHSKKRRQYEKIQGNRGIKCYTDNDLENIRAKKRIRYQQNLEQNRAKQRDQYKKDLLNNRAKKRLRYQQNLRQYRAKQLDRYKKDLLNNRAKKRLGYQQNLKQNRAKQLDRYKKDLLNNRAKKRHQYIKNLQKNRLRKRIHYFIHSQHERDRYRKYSDCKWLYNKQYYEKKILKFNSVKKYVGQNIIKKYSKFWSKNYIHMRNPVTITDIMNKLDIKNKIERRLEAERILRSSLYIRNNYIHNMYKILAVLKKKAEVHLTLVTECLTIDDKLHALCGISGHTASSENYFIDSTYSEQFISSQSLITNVKGQIINILPLVEAQAKKAWLCNTSCKINSFVIDRYKQFLEAINTCTLKKIPELLRKVCQKCTVNDLTDKLGHTQACYINPNLCKAMSLSIQLLSPHFPKVRFIKRLIYRMRADYQKLINLEKALNSGDIDILNELITVAQNRANMYKHHQSLTDLSDDDIISKYSKAFKALTKRSIDTPRYVCVSCERLCYKRNVSEISKVKTQLDIPIWRDLMAHIKNQNINPHYICLYCQRKFRNGLMPAYCVLNNYGLKMHQLLVYLLKKKFLNLFYNM